MKRSGRGGGIRTRPDDIVEQAGGLCLRYSQDRRLQVLLVSSLRNGRWGIPKGHLEEGETSHIAAAREAFEEAGVIETASDAIVGTFVYTKDSDASRYRVIVYRVEITEMADDYPERMVRTHRWVDVEDAMQAVTHDGLRELLRTLI